MKTSKRLTLKAPFDISQWWTGLNQREIANQRVIVLLALGLIVALALYLRLTGINWDSDTHLNPDERHLTNVGTTIKFPSNPIDYFDTAESPLNSYNSINSYVYGTLPLFATKATAELMDKAPIGSPSGGGLWADYNHLNLVGRTLSALVDVAGVIVIFLLGSYLFSRRVGLLAALLLSVTVLHIQYAHYFVVDGWLVFFNLATLYFAARAAKQGGRWNFALSGAMFGLAMACKVSAITLVAVITLAAVIRAWPALKERWTQSKGAIVPARIWSGELKEPLIGLALAAVVSLAVFRVAQPYAFVGPYPWSLDINAFLHDPTDPLKLFINPVWRQDVTTVLDIQSGDGFFPPGWTWTGRAPWLYGLENLLLWGMGIPLFMASAAGVLYACWRVVKHRDFVLLLFIATIAITFLWQAGRFTSYMRYILPIYAPMVLLGAYVLVELWMWTGFSQLPEKLAPLVRRLNGYLPALTRTAVAGIVVLTLLYGLAFTSIYRNPLTRVEASRWVYDNVPTGTVIANFHWDDGIPYNVDGRDAPSNFKFVDLKLYDLDTPEKTAGIIDSLDQTQYVMVSSDRLYRSITRAPAVYPIGTRFFDLLFAEQLGFELEKSFTSFPNLFGVTISDDGAEESFTVYDHPKVLVYRKSADFSRQKVEQLLGAPSLDPVLVPPSEAGKNALLLRPEDLETQRNGGTWTDIFDPDSFVNENPGFASIIWLLPVQALSLALVPVGLYLFRWLPDRGYLLLKPLGVLLLVYLVWLGVSLGLLEFTRGAVLGVMLLIMVLGIASGVVWRQQVLDYARQHWRAILTAEAVFLAAFFLFYGLRLLNPDLWHPFRGGEKPMDFAYLNAITRSTTLPPYDPWFAGGYINYYYFGQFITATLFKLTGIRPEVGYNLAVPLFFALTASATYSVGYNLTAAARSRIRRRPGGGNIPASSLRWAALLSVTLVLVVGNLHAFDQVVDGLSAKSAVHLGNGIPIISGAVGALGGLWQVIFGGASFPAIDYWAASRMMPPSISITEFPFFSFLFADLHAHLMSIPFAVASLGLGLALVLTGTCDRRPGRWISSARTLSLVTLLALVVGALRVTNSWDYPPFLLMGIVTVFIGELASEGRLTWPMALRFALSSAFLIALSIIAFYPFDRDYQQFQAGVSGTLETTVLRQYLAHFGLFIVIAGSLVAFLWARMLRRTGIALAARQFAVAVVGLVLLTTAFLLMVERLDSVFPISITNLTASDFLENLVRVRVPRTPEQSLPSFPIPLLPFAYLALAAVAVLIWHEFKRYRPDTPLRLFVLAMLALALLLSIGVDIVTIDNDIQRMNTVFKFYIHIWLFFAITSAFGVWYLLTTTRVRMPAITRVPRLRVHRLAMTRQLWVTVVGILFVATLAYPLAATPQRLNDRFLDRSPTTDGMAFMRDAVYQDEKGPVQLRDDLDAIQWLRNNVEGSPAIIEAHTPYYRWGARFSIYTGLPTVIGWDWHQVTQRRKYSSLVETRMNDVKQFYSDPDPAAALRILQKYQVSYVIVGQLERLYYDPAGLTKFDGGLDGNLELVYENASTRIYSVKAPSIPAAVEAPGPR